MTAVRLIEDLPEILRSAALTMHLAPNVKVGRTMPNGRRQVAASSGGYYVAEMKFNVAKFDEIREFIAISVKAGGGVTEFHIPNRRGRQLAPWPSGTGPATLYGSVQFSGGVALAGAVALKAKVIDIKARDLAATGAVTMNVRAYKAGTLRRGMALTVTDDLGRFRMHEVIEPPVVLASVTNYTDWRVEFRPPLRGAVKAGATLDWENPRVVMKFADVDTGVLTLLPYMRGEPVIRLRESFDRR